MKWVVLFLLIASIVIALECTEGEGYAACIQNQYGIEPTDGVKFDGTTATITSGNPDLTGLIGVDKIVVNGVSARIPDSYTGTLDIKKGSIVDYQRSSISADTDIFMSDDMLNNDGNVLVLRNDENAYTIKALADGRYIVNKRYLLADKIEIVEDGYKLNDGPVFEGIGANLHLSVVDKKVKVGTVEYFTLTDGIDYVEYKDNTMKIDGQIKDLKIPFGEGLLNGYDIVINPKEEKINAELLYAGTEFNGLKFTELAESTTDSITLKIDNKKTSVNDFKCESGCIKHSSGAVSSYTKYGPASVEYVEEDNGWSINSVNARTHVPGKPDDKNVNRVSMQDSAASFIINNNELISVNAIEGSPFHVQEIMVKEGREQYPMNKVFLAEPKNHQVVFRDKNKDEKPINPTVFMDGMNFEVNGNVEDFTDMQIVLGNELQEKRYIVSEGKSQTTGVQKRSLTPKIANEILKEDIIVYQTGMYQTKEDTKNIFIDELRYRYGLSESGAKQLFASCIKSGDCVDHGNGLETHGIKVSDVYDALDTNKFTTTVRQRTLATDRPENAQQTFENYVATINEILGTDLKTENYGDMQSKEAEGFWNKLKFETDFYTAEIDLKEITGPDSLCG